VNCVVDCAATRAVVSHARTLGMTRLLAIVSPGNDSSSRLLEKLGFAVSAIIRVSAPEPHFARLKALAAGLVEVREAHHVTGPDSLVLKVSAVSVGHLESVIEQLGRYGTPTTAVILSSPVRGRAVQEPAKPADRARPMLKSLASGRPEGRVRARGR